MSVEQAAEARRGASRVGAILFGLVLGVLVVVALLGALSLQAALATADRATTRLDAALNDRQVTACRTEQRAAIDQAIADKSAGDALLTRIRTEYDIAKALGQNPDLGPFVARAQQALADIDRAVVQQATATDVYQQGARVSRTNPGRFLRECQR